MTSIVKPLLSRRAIPLLLGAGLGLLSAGGRVPTPVAAASTACTASPTVSIPLGTSVTVAGNLLTTPFDPAGLVVCPVGAATHPALEFTATSTDSTPHDFLLCTAGIPDTSAEGTTTVGRSGHVTGSPVQRVGFHDLKYPEYKVQAFAAGPGTQVGCIAGPGGQGGAYSLTIRYFDAPETPAGNGFSFATKHLPQSNPSPSQPGGGEPSIAVDRLHGDRVYISTPVGVPSVANCLFPPANTGCQGTNFWFSLDGGDTFTFCNASFQNGGGDSTLAVDTTGSVYMADLAASDVPTGKLASSGPNAPPAPARNDDGSCNVPNTNPTGALSDRQWVAAYLPDPSQGTAAAKVVLSYNSLATSEPFECLGISGGAAWSPACSPIITDASITADGATNAVNGNQVFDSTGTVYSVFSTASLEDQGTSATPPIHNIYIGRSPDGISFTNRAVYLPQPASAVNIYRLFPVIAVDKADNLYVVWPETVIATGLTSVKFSMSTDHGDTWSPPVVVNSPDAANGMDLKSNVLPWVVGGDKGKVDVAWVASDAPNLDDPTHDWYVYMAQATDADSGTPTFIQGRVSPTPVRYAALCFRGTLCLTDGDDGRILLDFMTIDLDSHGMANISYANAGPDTEGFTTVSGVQPFTDFAKQLTGPSICSGACTSVPDTPAADRGLPNTRMVPMALLALAAGAVLLAALGLVRARRRGLREA
ncbi:MAG: hypothetical protein QOE92_2280 [Chloroflexota bacterium]|nr:hypothetical protein [Chloroflexota bacterium]